MNSTILTQNWKDLYTKLSTDNKVFLKHLLGVQHMAKFWDSVLPTLAAVKAKKRGDKYCIDETLVNLPDIIETPTGPMTRERMSWLLATLANVNRSNLMVLSQTKQPQYSSLVPLFMAAQRIYNNIKYNEWNRDSKYMDILLGKSLVKILEYPKFKIDPETIRESRENAMTVLTTGERKSNLLPPSRKIMLNDINGNSVMFSAYHPTITISLQLWLANVSVRHKDMILDIQDWDSMPDPIDAEVNQSIRFDTMIARGVLPWTFAK